MMVRGAAAEEGARDYWQNAERYFFHNHLHWLGGSQLWFTNSALVVSANIPPRLELAGGEVCYFEEPAGYPEVLVVGYNTLTSAEISVCAPGVVYYKILII